MEPIEKIRRLYEKCFADLNSWEKEFISDLYHNVQDPEEEMTRRQLDKLNEIWEEHGL